MRSTPTIIVAALSAALPALGQSIVPLAPVPGQTWAGAHRVTPDGTFIFGISGSAPLSPYVPTRWSTGGGQVGALEMPPNMSAVSISGVSASADVVVGAVGQGFEDTPARWVGGAFSLLSVPAGITAAVATGVSADGSTIVGWGYTPQGDRALRWDNGSVSTIAAPNASSTQITPDGSIIMGISDSGGRSRIFRWTEEEGVQIVGVLPWDLTFRGPATMADITPDGTVAAGYWPNDQSRLRSYRWTQDTGAVDLGVLPGADHMVSHAISADGSVIVGHAAGVDSWRAFIWTESGGLQDFGDFLLAHGVALEGWTFRVLSDVTPDGRTFVGTGIDPATGANAGFMVTIPSPGALGIAAVGGLTFLRRRRTT